MPKEIRAIGSGIIRKKIFQVPKVGFTPSSPIARQLQRTQREVSLKVPHRYLSTFSYRFNRRFWELQLFDRLLTACALYPTITYAELTGSPDSRKNRTAVVSVTMQTGFLPP